MLVVLVGGRRLHAAARPSWASRTVAALRGAPPHAGGGAAPGFVIGFYDGALGPGTGSFFVFALVGLMGYAFLQASAKAKIANFATNLGALIIFVPQGAVIWRVGC